MTQLSFTVTDTIQATPRQVFDALTQEIQLREWSGDGVVEPRVNGKFDVFFNVKTNPWDILPGALLVEEAGGIVTDILGKKLTYETTSVLATNGKVHDQMLELLQNV